MLLALAVATGFGGVPMQQVQYLSDMPDRLVHDSQGWGQLGYDVCQAANGKEALQVLEGEQNVSLVLVDWNMPEMNGLEFIREFRKRRDHAGIPVVFVTTESGEALKKEAKSMGATGWITKPFSTL